LKAKKTKEDTKTKNPTPKKKKKPQNNTPGALCKKKITDWLLGKRAQKEASTKKPNK